MRSSSSGSSSSSSSSSKNNSGGNNPRRSGNNAPPPGFPHIQHARPQRNQGPSTLKNERESERKDNQNSNNQKAKAKEQLSVANAALLTSGVGELLLDNSPRDEAGQNGPRGRRASSSSGSPLCIVCCEAIEYCSLGSCNHHEVCHVCSLRMRALYKNNACSFCKTELTTVVFTKDLGAKFEEINLKNCIFDDGLAIYYSDRDILERGRHMLKSNCPLQGCEKSLQSLNDLKRHISRDHPGLTLCNICLDHRKVFAHERKLFSREELAKHTKEGDANDPSFKGHQECLFCHQLFYGKDELYEHLELEHEHCFICRKKGNFNEYYINYASLENHFRRDHFMCEDEACRAKAFVVFSSEIDLRGHQANVHMKDMKLSRSQQRQMRQIDVGFVYASKQEETDRRRNPRQPRASDPREEQAPQQQRVIPQDRNQPESSTSVRVVLPGSTPSPVPITAPSTSSAPKTATPPPGFENVRALSTSTASANKKSAVAPPPGFDKAPPPDRASDRGKGPKQQQQQQQQQQQPRSDIKSRAPAGFGQLTRTESVETSKLRGGMPKPVSEMVDSEDSGSDSDDSPPPSEVSAPVIDPAVLKRNQDLMQRLRLIFKGDTDKIDQFRQISQSFRTGELTAGAYYELYLQMLGPHANKIFQEMVDLLPEEDKKAALLAAKSDRKAIKKGSYTVPRETPQEIKTNIRTIPSKSEPSAPVDPNTITCRMCSKVVQKADYEWHAASHFAADYGNGPSAPVPASSSSQPVPTPRPQPQFVDFPSLKSSSSIKEDKSKAPRSSYTTALTGMSANNFAETYQFDLGSLPPLPSSSSSSSSYSGQVSGQTSASGSGSGGKKGKGKGKVLLHFG